MFKTKLFKKTLLLVLVIAFLDIVAEVFYFHWTIWWYDVVLHFLAGFSLSMFFVNSYYSNFDEENKSKIIFFSLFFVLFVGVLWELSELRSGDTSLSAGIYYIRDTISDIIIDVCGGLFGALYSFKFFKK